MAVTPSRNAQWLKLRKPTAAMLTLLILGTSLAVAHHLVYRHLSRKLVSDYSQPWVSRISTSTALAVKSCWSIAIGLALQNVLWYSFRRHFFKISSINKLLDIENNVLGFISFDAIRDVPLAMDLGAIVWLLPIIPIIVPGTLSVRQDPQAIIHSQSCLVPTYGIANLHQARWGNSSQGFYSAMAESSSWDGIDATANPTLEVERIVEETILGNGIIPFPSPCGPNCTYDMTFQGPGLECVEYPNYVLSSFDFENQGIVINTSARPIPDENTWVTPGNDLFDDEYRYFANITYAYGNYLSIWTQLLNNNTLHPAYIEPFHGNPKRLKTMWQTLACSLQNASYSLSVQFDNNNFLPNITKLSGVKVPVDVPTAAEEDIRHLIDLIAPTQSFFNSLVGSVYNGMDFMSPLAEPNTKVSNVLYTKLITTTEDIPVSGGLISHQKTWIVNEPLLTGPSELFTNLTLSLFSVSPPSLETVCTSTQSANVYCYAAKWLSLTYALGFAATLCCISLGIYAVRDNGFVAGEPFSQILAATRNPGLDRVLQAAKRDGVLDLGNRDFLKQRLLYGTLSSGHQDGMRVGVKDRAAFGSEDQVVMVLK